MIQERLSFCFIEEAAIILLTPLWIAGPPRSKNFQSLLVCGELSWDKDQPVLSVIFLGTDSSVQFSRSVISDSLWPHELQHTRPPCPSPTPGVYPNSCPSSQWCHPAISSSVVPSPPAPNPSQHQGLFQRVNSLHEIATVLEFQLQHQSFQWTPRTDLL